MTEAEWLTCDDPRVMLEALKGIASDRKLRLFACACCRLVWESLPPYGRTVAEVAESFADGKTSDSDLDAARQRALNAAHRAMQAFRRRWQLPAEAVPFARAMFAGEAAHAHKPFLVGRMRWVAVDAAIRPTAPRILRELLGNPFLPVTLDPACRTPTVLALAHAAYDERTLPSGELDAERLAVLADALEDAGAMGDILTHLRGPGPHVRGCWALDLALGKE